MAVAGAIHSLAWIPVEECQTRKNEEAGLAHMGKQQGGEQTSAVL